MRKFVQYIFKIIVVVVFFALTFVLVQFFASSTSEKAQSDRQQCQLPNYPSNGYWSIFNTNITRKTGDFVPIGTILVVNCDKNHGLVGTRTLVCFDNGWSQQLGQCVAMCSSRYNTSIMSVHCSLNNVPLRDCTDPLEGTVADIKCANFFENPDLVKHPIHVCSGGNWTHNLPKCEPTCGLKNGQSPKLIINGEDAPLGEYPWQTAIYNRTGKLLICGGSIINQHLVVTAAHCLTDDDGVAHPKEWYSVVVGKLYRELNHPNDKNAQHSLVKDIFVPEQYNGRLQNYVADIALVLTEKFFQLSYNVLPICVDWNLEYQHTLVAPTESIIGYVSGWGLTSENVGLPKILKHLSIPLVSREECKKHIAEEFDIFLTDDKLCAGYLNSSTSLCKGDSGGGLAVKYGPRFYLTGVVSNSPLNTVSSDGGCDSQKYTLFTKVIPYIRDFLFRKVEEFKLTGQDYECANDPEQCSVGAELPSTTPEPIIQKNCTVPALPTDGNLTLVCTSSDCPLLSTLVGKEVLPSTTMRLSCSEGYESKDITCENGNWSTSVACLKTCPVLKSVEAWNVTCTFGVKVISCVNPPEGTIAAFKCLKYYQHSKGDMSAICRNGNWSSGTPNCKLICGQVHPRTGTLMLGGRSTPKGNSPWQVSMYKREDKSFLCSGVLIGPKIVITALRCFLYPNSTQQPRENFIMAVGKHYRAMNDLRDVYAQYSDIFHYYAFSKPYDLEKEYTADIALAVLYDTFVLSYYVMPVCLMIDKTGNVRKEVKDYNTGVMTAFDEISDELKELDLPIVDKDTCTKYGTDNGVPASLLQDKICAGYINKTRNTCDTDTGSGLVVKHNRRYYLIGLASSALDQGCDGSVGYSYFIDPTIYFKSLYLSGIFGSQDDRNLFATYLYYNDLVFNGFLLNNE